MGDIAKGAVAVGVAGAVAAGMVVAGKAMTSAHKEEKSKVQKPVEVVQTDKKQPAGKFPDTPFFIIERKTDTEFACLKETKETNLTVTTVREAAEDIQKWFGSVVEKVSTVLENSNDSEARVESEKVIAQAELEVSSRIESLKKSVATSSTASAVSEESLDGFFSKMQTSVQSQLGAVKTLVLEGSGRDKASLKTTLTTITVEFSEKVSTEVVSLEEDVIVVADEEVQPGHQTKPVTINIGPSTTITETSKVEHTVETVSITTIETTKTEISSWLSRVVARVTESSQETDVTAIEKITTEAQGELAVIIDKAKASCGGKASAERSFATTLEWIQTVAISQLTVLKDVVVQSSSGDKADLKARLENLMVASKKQMEQVLEVHIVTEGSSGVSQKKVTVVQETEVQIQKRTRQEMLAVVEWTKSKLQLWLETLIKNIRAAIRTEGGDVKKTIQVLIKNSQAEVDEILQSAKSKLLTFGGSLSIAGVQASTVTAVANAQGQALNCIDNLKLAVATQLSTLHEVIVRVPTQDVSLLEERLTARLGLVKHRVEYSLGQTADVVISAALEGKTVTVVETADIPKSFSDVRVFAFDLVGTITDYQSSIAKLWQKIVQSKQNSKLQKIDVNGLVTEWHMHFLERKKTSSESLSDDGLLRVILLELLKQRSVENDLSNAEIDALCSGWRSLSLFADVSAGIRRLKQQRHGQMITVAFSDAFSTRSMIEMARACCLCWHAQFSAEMFAASGSSVVAGASQLLALDGPQQLAIVSSNPSVLEAAKVQGFHTVLVRRSGAVAGGRFDAELDGIDMLAESYEAMMDVYDHASNEDVQRPQRTWFQRVVDTAVDAAETVERTVIG